ncbi:unnamed protein product, partial [Staurois parvus]
MRHCSGICSSLTLPCAPTLCPLQRPRPSPPADAGIRLLCPVPVTSGRTGIAGGARNLKIFKNVIFFFFYILHMLCSAPCLHYFYVVCSF